MKEKNVVIVGSGIAALTVADKLSQYSHINVIILTKSVKWHSNSIRAQGGIAAAISENDHWKAHLQDTLNAGCHINNVSAAELLVQRGPVYVNQLINEGLPFDRHTNGRLQLGKEGAHLKRRILHAGGDATGKVVVEFMLDKLKDKVTFIENQTVIDVVVQNNQCVGVITANSNDKRTSYTADFVILATGGCGGLYQVTSNDTSIIGDGIALAYQAGAELVDLEFMQFHPTMLHVDGQSYGLVSEAVRGEGARLVTGDGKRIMRNVHPLEDLAPRDIVAREIYKYLMAGKKVYLDISMIDHFRAKFPTISDLCDQAGVRIINGFIPVAPGAHFLMGGIKTNVNGQTSVKGLYAVGEVACTGVHGANRLASNSLLEGIVFGNLTAEHILANDNVKEEMDFLLIKTPTSKDGLVHLPSKDDIREIMTSHAGIVRTREGLETAKQWLEQCNEVLFLRMYVRNYTKEQLEIIYMLKTAWLIVTSALARTESRGGHYRTDYPLPDDVVWMNQSVEQKITYKEPIKVRFLGDENEQHQVN